MKNSPSIKVNIQLASQADFIPSRTLLRKWVIAALSGFKEKAELTIRIVDEKEMIELNSKYRHQNKATNVLSFPQEILHQIKSSYLGDIVICAPIANKETYEQRQIKEAHWAHLTVHGVLHLLGFAHSDQQEAETMEADEDGQHPLY